MTIQISTYLNQPCQTQPYLKLRSLLIDHYLLSNEESDSSRHIEYMSKAPEMESNNHFDCSDFSHFHYVN